MARVALRRWCLIMEVVGVPVVAVSLMMIVATDVCGMVGVEVLVVVDLSLGPVVMFPCVGQSKTYVSVWLWRLRW